MCNIRLTFKIQIDFADTFDTIENISFNTSRHTSIPYIDNASFMRCIFPYSGVFQLAPWVAEKETLNF